jgi:hypothetical protein
LQVPANSRPLDIHKVFGEKRDKMLNPLLWSAFIVCCCFLIPFYRKDDFGKRDTKVEYMTTWAFVSLVFAALITILTFIGFYFFWQDYDIPEHPSPFIPWSRRGKRSLEKSAYVSIRQHTSAYVSIRQHTFKRSLPEIS